MFNFKVTKSDYNCLKYENVLQIFLLSYFEYWQIWLNILMDDFHWATSQNWKKKKKKKKYTTFYIDRILGAKNQS
jgi:hypothetical protein